MKKLFNIFAFSLVFLIMSALLLVLYTEYVLAPTIPVKQAIPIQRETRQQHAPHTYILKNNWLHRSKYGLWEEYITGDAYERGVVLGKLNKELMRKQEEAFMEQIHQLIPSDGYLKFLRFFIRFFNRNLAENIPAEYLQEIYGESLEAPGDFDYIGSAYDRMLNYHAAHDIGHALQSLALVGCTSFAAWDERTSDSSLLIGRNFDFYVGDKFAEDKIVLFCQPTTGNNFAMITWGGFVGCVSGMNTKGITVTMNAAKSAIPMASATPISILGREILQYANTIEEAYIIAKRRKTFVSETLMIGSAAEHHTALIEKSMDKTVLYKSRQNYIVCANHYQSKAFEKDETNAENMRTSASAYRQQRLEELLAAKPQLNVTRVAEILRDQKGLREKNIGIGNEKAINQLIGHHSVIFQPEQLRMWVSTAPYQLGQYVCYDLKKIFTQPAQYPQGHLVSDSTLTIPADTFLQTKEWKNFLRYREIKTELINALKHHVAVTDETQLLKEFVASNPEYWETYYWAGEYCFSRKQKKQAIAYYNTALSKEINATQEADKIRARLAACQ